MLDRTTTAALIFLMYFMGPTVFAQSSGEQLTTSNLRVEEKNNNSEFELFLEVSQFNNAGVKLNGQGAGTAFRYSFNDSFTFSFSGAQAYGSGGNISSLYTALRSHIQYNFLGFHNKKFQRVYFEDQVVSETEQGDAFSLAFALGVSQYFFNGSSSVTPGTGFEAYLRSQFRLFGVSWSAAVGFPVIYINQTQVTGLIFTFGPNFEF